jgi:predicted RNA-binding Zn ribbon-like protein
MPSSAAAAAPSGRVWMLPDEPEPVRLMSTIWADTHGIHDDLLTPADLDEWLDAIRTERAIGHATESAAHEAESVAHAAEADLAQARALRDAVRRLAAFVTQDTRTAAASAMTDVAAALEQVNSTAAALPAPLLALRDGRLELIAGGGVSPVTAGLARVAEQAARLLGGDDAARLRACYAPGCVLYFIKTHPRREWCSVGCGNRVRAARHYQRIREQTARENSAAYPPPPDSGSLRGLGPPNEPL